ncbi:MAG: helix-turn-helix domain-containing protein [Candidatus Adiutrix sp.]|jgi:DNA-binding XRE family transcriptional regulator|nr:helix-turn-helix domain-containing protein [Candidatus Adiutrix sp.]
MNTPIRHQIIEKDGLPLFVLVPYKEYLSFVEPGEATSIPLAVSKAVNMEGKSLVRAWREYKGLSQAKVAARMGISRPAYAQMEEKGANLRSITVQRLASALEVEWAQLGDNAE